MNRRWDETDDMELKGIETELAGDLAEMRASATIYAERAWARPQEARRSVAATPVLRWAGAAVAVALLVSGGLRTLHHANALHGAASGVAVQQRQANAVSDEALLEQIQSDLSTGVPAAMQPLEATNARGADASGRRSE